MSDKSYKKIEKYFTGYKGMKLFFQAFEKKNAEAALLFLHGIGEHSGRYQFPLQYFSKFPYCFYLFDQRGHGKSQGARIYSPSLRYNVEDLHLFIQKLQKLHKKIFLVAHSFGGQIAIHYLAKYKHEITGALLSSPNLQVLVPIPAFKKNVAGFLSWFLPKVKIPNELDPYTLSHDPIVVRQYIEDALVEKSVSLRLVTDILKDQEKIMQCAEKIETPLFLMHGGADQICSPEATENFFRQLKMKDKKLKIYEGFFHEIFNEKGKERVFEDMQKWLERHL